MGSRARNRGGGAAHIGTPTPARRAALEVLRRVRRGDLADRAFDRATGSLSERDRHWTQELVYGTLRMRGRLDHTLGSAVRGGIQALEPDVLDVLRLGVYQLAYMGSVPAYAAISESVELARAAGAGKASGLVSGVLHALARAPERIAYPERPRDPVEHLVTWGSHPRWLVERWVERWGLEATQRLVDLNNRRPELYLRPVGADAWHAAERLSSLGMATEPVPLAPGALRLLPPAEVRDALAAVPALVQDPAAQLVVLYAAPAAGMRVLDLCAAPGGKAIGMADSGASVLASDVSLRRVQRVRDNVLRLGWGDRVRAVVADARHPPAQPADLVLVDVPCTGTGTLRRHPDARWRVTAEDFVPLGRLQADILDAAARHVRVGGHLVYSTCSLEPEENELQIERFLTANPEFVADPAPGVVARELVSQSGWLMVLPQSNGTDGAFAARLRRQA